MLNCLPWLYLFSPSAYLLLFFSFSLTYCFAIVLCVLGSSYLVCQVFCLYHYIATDVKVEQYSTNKHWWINTRHVGKITLFWGICNLELSQITPADTTRVKTQLYPPNLVNILASHHKGYSNEHLSSQLSKWKVISNSLLYACITRVITQL